MLDNKMILFEIQNEKSAATNKSLILSGCNAILFPEKTVYSELDDLNFSFLNSNDYGFGCINVEFCFENNLKEPYVGFYSACFSIRTENEIVIKINGDPKAKSFSKINKDNKFVLGISYYFRSEIEREKILNCNIFCIEGFVSLDTKTNIYGIMCRLMKKEGNWSIEDANTYRIYEKNIITNICH